MTDRLGEALALLYEGKRTQGMGINDANAIVGAAARDWHALTQTGFVVDDAEIGYCRKHDDVARRYADGSWSCWWECTVEANGYHEDNDFVPLVDALTVTPTPEEDRD